MKGKEIIELAQEILEYEKEISLGKNVKINQDKIEKIMFSLSFEDILKIDEYITKNF